MEKIVRNAVYRLVFWRIFGDIFALVRGVLIALNNYASSVEKATWLLETEAARTYYAVTGLDPGYLVGDIGRFSRALGDPAELEGVEED